MGVRLSGIAESDLEEIGNFIAEDNPLRADGFVLELLDRCYGLANYSSRYPVVGSLRGYEVRRCPYRSYLIFYVVLPDGLEIARILHSARDYMRLVFPEA
jgi:plasmid stabilization system protein ParE